MPLGYCCINLQLRNMATPVYTGRTCQESRFTPELAGYLGLCNAQDLVKIIEWNERSGIKVFRVSSHMFPHATNPKKLYCPADLPHGAETVRCLRDAGRLAKKYGHVLAMHPPHFVSLASDSEGVQQRSREELTHHLWIAETLEDGGASRVNLNWHFGRGFDPKHVPVFVNNWRKLPQGVRDRACIENDDKKNCWSVSRLKEHLWPETGCRLSFDAFHWFFCGDETQEEAFRMAQATWNGSQMECHMSSSAERWPKTPTHAAYLWDTIPEYMLAPDVYTFIEAGAKELAVFKYAKDHGILLNPSSLLRFP